MSKIIMTLYIPESKLRKKSVKSVQKHKDKSKYNRKMKHKAPERYQSDRGFCLGDVVNIFFSQGFLPESFAPHEGDALTEQQMGKYTVRVRQNVSMSGCRFVRMSTHSLRF